MFPRRVLTIKEILTIENYNLSLKLEKRVQTFWSSGENRLEGNFIYNFMWWLVAIFGGLGSVVLLWVNYFWPGLVPAPGLLDLIRVAYWIILPLIIIIQIARIKLIIDDKTKIEALKKWALDIWCRKTGLYLLYLIISIVSALILSVGFFRNECPLTAIMSFICFIIIFFLCRLLRYHISKVICDIVAQLDEI